MPKRKPRDPAAGEGRKAGRIKRQQKNTRTGAKKCRSRKRRYRDHAEAVRALQSAARSGHDYIPIRAYECDTCGGWHLSSQPLGEAA